MASASTLNASSSSGGFVSERVFPIRMHMVTEEERVRKSLATLGKALRLLVPTKLTYPQIRYRMRRVAE